MIENAIFKHGWNGYSNHGCRCSVCKTGMTSYQKKWRSDNLEEIKAKDRKRNSARSAEMKTYLKQYYGEHRKEISENNREWVKNNRVRLNLAKKRYDEARCLIDGSYKMAKRLRTRIYKALRGIGAKSDHTLMLLGCSMDELKQHLEQHFLEGMSWDNYGEWHVDHIRPCSSFDLALPEQQRVCFNWKNLQPLWAKENLVKNDKWAI